MTNRFRVTATLARKLEEVRVRQPGRRGRGAARPRCEQGTEPQMDTDGGEPRDIAGGTKWLMARSAG